jgi:hypothetical protein
VYEHHREPVLDTGRFLRRVRRHGTMGVVLVVFSLGLGTLGYHVFGQLAWIDAFLNASMILTGMGPVDPMRTPEAKLFASFYALYSGIVFVSTAAILLAPFVHRMLHRFHAER